MRLIKKHIKTYFPISEPIFVYHGAKGSIGSVRKIFTAKIS